MLGGTSGPDRGGFESIPTTWYFIMATMTTVGDGDHYPLTVGGRVVCGLCMLCGIMVLALPIIVIGMVQQTLPGPGDSVIPIMLSDIFCIHCRHSGLCFHVSFVGCGDYFTAAGESSAIV